MFTPLLFNQVRWYVVMSPGPLLTARNISKATRGPWRGQSLIDSSLRRAIADLKSRNLLFCASRWSPKIRMSPLDLSSERMTSAFLLDATLRTKTSTPSNVMTPESPSVTPASMCSSETASPNLLWVVSQIIHSKISMSSADVSLKRAAMPWARRLCLSSSCREISSKA